jgi:DNA topoisomerase IB
MKKFIYSLSVFAMFMVWTPEVEAKGGKENKEELTAEQKVRLSEIESRLEEIKTMDLKAMSKEERKEVKKELKEMNVEARQLGGGVYISVGAIIIILLLIILLA